MFWVWIGLLVLAIIGASIVAGRTLGKPKQISHDRQSHITALKASGALKHRKSNRE